MAITSARMQIKRGNEVDFDSERMLVGEWALSTDKRIVRICVAPNTCIRMATYDAFEVDMAEVQKILEECQSIEEAVVRINAEVSENAQAVVEYTEQAKRYRDEAEQFRNQAKEIVGVGIATTETAGLVKPDGETITVDEDGTIHSIGGGGTAGTTDYEDLENKPSINGIELSGNKTLSELGIASAGDLSTANENINVNSEKISEVEVKVDTIIEKAELNIKNSAKGENLHLTDSANSKAVEFGLYGKAEQKQYSGKNLLPNNAISQTINGVTFTVSIDSSVTLNGIATNDINNFYLNQGNINLDNMFATCDGIENLSGIYFAINNGIQTFNVYGTNKKVALNGTMNYARLYIDSGATFNNATIKPMISVEGGEYEPYVGGIPSPNPDYPQEITVSGSDGSVEVVSCGKNLLKNTTVSKTIDGVTFTVNEDGSVTANGTATADAHFKLRPTCEANALYQYNGCILSGTTGGSASTYMLAIQQKDSPWKMYGMSTNGDSVIKISDDDSTLVNFFIKICKDVTVTNQTFYPMIRLASDTDSTYEPYKETVSTIPTPNGLCGIKVNSGGNYTDENGQQWICDEIVKYADGSGKRIQRIGKVVFDGSDDEKWTLNEMNDNTAKYVIDNIVSIKIGTNAICNLLPFISGGNGAIGPVDYYCFAFRNGLGGFTFRLSSSIQTVAQLRTFLNEKNLIVYYVLATPIETDLTAEEIAEIEKLHTFYPITNISNDADCGMEVTYIADSKNYIDGQLAIQKAQQEEALATMLLLMPEEVQASMIENDTNNLLNESEV